MKYISEITLTELVKSFVEDLDHTRQQQERKNKTFNLLYRFENLYLKEIEKQNSLINKMRCCGNCKHIEFRFFTESMLTKNMTNYCSDCIRFMKKIKKINGSLGNGSKF